jgi:uncharacterized membrane protein
MAKSSFFIGEALRFGWENVTQNLGLFILVVLIQFGISFVFSLLTNVFKNNAPLATVIITLTSIVVSMVVQMGIIKFMLAFTDGGKGAIGDLFTSWHLFFKYLAGAILYVLIVLGGMILLIIPGIIWGLKFQFWNYLIVDKEYGPIQALKASSALTQGRKWDLLGFGTVCSLVVILGALALGVGLLVAVPTVMLAMAFIYRQLEVDTIKIPNS